MRDIVQQAMRGDREAFGMLVGRISDRMYAIATRILRDRGLVSHDAGIVVVSPDGDVLRHGGPSDLGDHFVGDTTVVAELCAALA